MKLSTKEKEKLALQQVEYDDFYSEVKMLEKKISVDFSLNRFTEEIINLVELKIPYAIKMLHKKEVKRHSLYASTLKNFLWNVLEQALKQWGSLEERELNRQTFVEIIMSKEAKVKERGFVRLGKFLDRALKADPKEEEDFYFSKWLYFQISILEMNEISIDFVKGKFTDALSDYLKMIENLDLFDSPSYGDL